MSLLRSSLVAASVLTAAIAAYAQAPGTVQWSASAAHSGDGSLVVALKADVEKGWHIYAPTQPAGGPMPLVIRIEPGAPYELTGKIEGTAATKQHDASFNLDTEFYTGSFTLRLPVRTAEKGSGDIPLSVRYQMCSETTCMPPKTIHLVAKGNA